MSSNIFCFYTGEVLEAEDLVFPANDSCWLAEWIRDIEDEPDDEPLDFDVYLYLEEGMLE